MLGDGGGVVSTEAPEQDWWKGASGCISQNLQAPWLRVTSTVCSWISRNREKSGVKHWEFGWDPWTAQLDSLLPHLHRRTEIYIFPGETEPWLGSPDLEKTLGLWFDLRKIKWYQEGETLAHLSQNSQSYTSSRAEDASTVLGVQCSLQHGNCLPTLSSPVVKRHLSSWPHFYMWGAVRSQGFEDWCHPQTNSRKKEFRGNRKMIYNKYPQRSGKLIASLKQEQNAIKKNQIQGMRKVLDI